VSVELPDSIDGVHLNLAFETTLSADEKSLIGPALQTLFNVSHMPIVLEQDSIYTVIFHPQDTSIVLTYLQVTDNINSDVLYSLQFDNTIVQDKAAYFVLTRSA
jgi:hypothetical protein